MKLKIVLVEITRMQIVCLINKFIINTAPLKTSKPCQKYRPTAKCAKMVLLGRCTFFLGQDFLGCCIHSPVSLSLIVRAPRNTAVASAGALY